MTDYAILRYHNIHHDDDDLDLQKGCSEKSISYSDFRAEMRYLKENLSVISMEDLTLAYSGQKTLPTQSVAVTCDGAWLSSYVCAWPILEELQIPATFYLPIDVIEAHQLDISNAQQKAHSYQYCCMTWEHIRQMNSSKLINFGVSVDNHALLRFLNKNNPSQIINTTIHKIEEELNQRLCFFAYSEHKAQDIHETVHMHLKFHGFHHCVTNIFGLNSLEYKDLFYLKRIPGGLDDYSSLFAFTETLKTAS